MLNKHWLRISWRTGMMGQNKIPSPTTHQQTLERRNLKGKNTQNIDMSRKYYIKHLKG